MQILRRQPPQLQLLFALVCTAEEPNVFLTQSQQIEPLIVAEQGEQWPNLESFSHHYEFGCEIPQQEIAEDLRRAKKRETDGPISLLLRSGRHGMHGLNQTGCCDGVNPGILQELFDFPDDVTDLRAPL
jgi:hypothetical protein